MTQLDTTPLDPFEIFKALNPISEEPAELDAANLAALQAIFDTPVPARLPRISSPRRRRRWMAGGMGVVVVVGAVAAFTFLGKEQVSDPRGVSCYSAASLDSDRTAIAPAVDPIAACAELWRNGTIGSGSVPELHGCVTSAGAAAVFPAGASICSDLGLRALDATLGTEQQRIVALQDRIIETFGLTCVSEQDAIGTAQHLLDESGLQGWSVVSVDNYTATDHCTAAGLDVPTRHLTVGGRPDEVTGSTSQP